MAAKLAAVVPEANLAAIFLPASAAPDASPTSPHSKIAMWLLDPNSPSKLSSASISAALSHPPFWCVAWPSGRVLAEMIANGATDARGKRVADFGCGSGLVAIAAAQAGAAAVSAYDLDEAALLACRENARLNDVRIATYADFFADVYDFDLCFVADVFYDRENLPLLSKLLPLCKKLIVADCRAHNLQHFGLNKIAERESCTWPDVDASDQFRRVSIYESPD